MRLCQSPTVVIASAPRIPIALLPLQLKKSTLGHLGLRYNCLVTLIASVEYHVPTERRRPVSYQMATRIAAAFPGLIESLKLSATDLTGFSYCFPREPKVASERAVIERNEINEDVVLVRVTDFNKRCRFQKAVDDFQARRTESESVRQNLALLNGELADNFGLKEVAILDIPFRLLVSKSSAIAQDLSREVDSYIVVSYCWPSSDWKTANRDRS